ncbi:Pyrimidine 5'-nucleotidase YjjG [Acaryochloris thomasi RCC1774]|uniref:Pyrimidine 5'-nucleotidase YjjG n=1 Tax=Acaryochloris thomasi RCC1774 TaxID=1764569 RepID=A0A2W1JPJ6_9CYAN|nr:HAD-IA family hydrolase [Acaryochloris thomasi]PZD75260.1 Pyrimidine 5'-nucleotidase YjjG [Acaryochloris thomasi RCC1774]
MPHTIFLDAVGTLFGIRGTVGEIYGRFAAEAGVQVNAQQLNQAFIESFLAAPRAAFPGVKPAEIPAREFAWWQAVADQSFTKVGVIDQFANFDDFFKVLFDHFAKPDPWIVYPEVLQTLQQWKRQGIELGVISNFDTRLHSVLDVLGLAQFFTSVTISTAVGAAKPQADIFEVAIAKHKCSPEQAIHIGDSWSEDYQGAKAAGLQAVWLYRKEDSIEPERSSADSIKSLAELQFSSD